MLKSNPGTLAAQLVRLDAKTQDYQLMVEAIKGTGMSAWEAEVLIDTVREVYFAVPGNGPMLSGQLLWTCVSCESPHGMPLTGCRLRRANKKAPCTNAGRLPKSIDFRFARNQQSGKLLDDRERGPS
ncbi:hypothetical protein BVY04_00525 [bacterium M21]|nr:hypothetical protein BVY04_00525 [bacterium M21]